ncbi:MAG: hypothetical protein RLY70_3762 [Planctomycetota bacterium]|jgi:hypothetical protein
MSTTVSPPRLTPLRRQLQALRSARQRTRIAAAVSAVAIAVSVAIAVFWAIDLKFELSVAQRLVVLGLAAVGLVWSYRAYARELLGVSESLVEVALLVERRHRIDTDLVAALQFEQPEARDWGSSQLETAVIEQVADRGQALDVFDGFSRAPASGRLFWLTIAGGGLLVAMLLFPGHARVLWNRLLLGALHYPTNTLIQRIAINDQLVLDAATHGTAPRRSAAAQSRGLEFFARVEGERPASGLVRVSSLRGGATRPVELVELTVDERRTRLDAAVRALEPVAKDAASTGPNIDDATVLPYLDCDAPAAAGLWRQARDSQASWSDVLAAARAALENWEANAAGASVFRGQLDRMVESIEYKVFLGDAWTDPAEVAMTPRPLIEPRLAATAPSYVSDSNAIREIGPGRLSVVEGSTVSVGLACANGKRLREAWLTVLALSGPKRWNLVAEDDSRLRWRLDDTSAPFSRVEEDLRFELQVRDEDGLTLETPLAGLVRVQPDRSPSAVIQLVHRVVLPNAKPVVQFRVLDDHAVASATLRIRVQRGEASNRARERAAADPGKPEAEAPEASAEDESNGDEVTIPVTQTKQVIRGAELPWNGKKAVDLTPLKLVKGDQLSILLEVTDYRGDRPGVTFGSEPAILEISDEAGVLSAVLEADQRAEERLSEIIKRQLGIGEAP